MRLPWYVALDRWVRRRPKTYRLYVLAPLAPAALMVPPQPWYGIVATIFVLSVSMAGAEMVLEHYADKWREDK